MNSSNRNAMFPYRRNGGKKRGKPQGGGGRRQGGGGRRVPNSAAELLTVLQPTTKSLAQVLAGNTKASGQLVHARNILEQAERFIDERAVDRLPPKQREDFLEQLARLKLTLADADDEARLAATPEEEIAEAPTVSMDRLRELALSIATTGIGDTESDTPKQPDAESQVIAADADIKPQVAREAVPKEAPDRQQRAKRGDTLRLKTTVRKEPAETQVEAAR